MAGPRWLGSERSRPSPRWWRVGATWGLCRLGRRACGIHRPRSAPRRERRSPGPGLLCGVALQARHKLPSRTGWQCGFVRRRRSTKECFVCSGGRTQMRAQVLRTLLPIPAGKPLGSFTFSITCFRELQS